MADDKAKKPRIDLKARLNKGAAAGGGAGGSAVPLPIPGPSSPGGSAPPASGPGSSPSAVPAPVPAARPSGGGIAPPPGISPGIPLPPFAQQRPAPQAAPKASAHAQTIKVEIGEEVHEERKKASKRTALYAILTLALGVGLGFVAGGAKAKGDRFKLAVEGAGLLEKDVKAANEKMKTLDEKLTAGAEKLGTKAFPDDLVNDLSSINIPFEAANLDNKHVGDLPAKTMKQVLAYTEAVEDLNRTKDSLKNLLGAAKAPVEKAWKEEKEPVANFSVVFRGDQKGMLAELVPNKDPFPFKNDWPASYTILKQVRSQQGTKTEEKKANRWTKGDLTGSDPVAIPVDQASVAAFSSEELVFKLSKGMRDIREILQGRHDNPTTETAGLIKEGDDLANELHKFSLQR